MGGIGYYTSGIRGLYDYGPLGVMLKKNLVEEWYRDMVIKKRHLPPIIQTTKEATEETHTCTRRYIEILPMESSILGSRKLYEASGHLGNFEDVLMDDYLSKERVRYDRATEVLVEEEDDCFVIKVNAPNQEIARQWKDLIEARLAPGCKLRLKDHQVWLYVESVLKSDDERSSGEIVLTSALGTREGVRVAYHGIAAPSNNSPFMTEGRKFNLMFQTFLGAIDPIASMVEFLLDNRSMSRQDLEHYLREKLQTHLVYMRPETAQGTYLQYLPCKEAYGLRLPFGLAQIGKSFRNEISPEHYIFRTTEFEQMELQFFVHPDTEAYWFDFWRGERMAWWRKLLNRPESLSERVHEQRELAHYARTCVDIDYSFPFGRGEIEGIASRTDFDLKQHAHVSGSRFDFIEQEHGQRIYPFIIEPAAGLNRGMLALLHDAFTEEHRGKETRILLKLHRRLAPFKAAIFPLTQNEHLRREAQMMAESLWEKKWSISYEEKHSIGKRYARHDEIGTPYCITIDNQTLEDGTVTVRDRDTSTQERLHKQEIELFLLENIV